MVTHADDLRKTSFFVRCIFGRRVSNLISYRETITCWNGEITAFGVAHFFWKKFKSSSFDQFPTCIVVSGKRTNWFLTSIVIEHSPKSAILIGVVPIVDMSDNLIETRGTIKRDP